MTEESSFHMQERWQPSCSLLALQERARLLRFVREFFNDRGVMEVETPLMCQTITPDPNLQAVKTVAECTETDGVTTVIGYLQPSPEFAMKRLLAAGSGPIYQVCKAFRASESGRRHNPEFTMLEWYRPGFLLEDLMQEVEVLLASYLGEKTLLRNTEYLRYSQVFQHYCGIDPLIANVDDLREVALRFKIIGAENICGSNLPLWLDLIFSHIVQPNLGSQGQLTFISDFPACQAALAKLDATNPAIANRFEVYFKGIELANGFYELTDKDEQENRFLADQKVLASKGVSRALDSHFLAALESGLPESSGVALGIDRLLMLKMGLNSLEQVLAFTVDRA